MHPPAVPIRAAVASPRTRGRASRVVHAVVRSLRPVVEGLALVYLVAVVSLCVWPVAARVAGWQPSLILTGSMRPAIEPGDVVVSAPERADDVALGTVVVVRDPAAAGRLLAHRLVDRGDGDALITKGDANRGRDSTPVPTRDLVGAVRIAVPKVGLPALWLRQGRIAPFALWLLADLLALVSVTRFVGRWSRRRFAGVVALQLGPLAPAPAPAPVTHVRSASLTTWPGLAGRRVVDALGVLRRTPWALLAAAALASLAVVAGLVVSFSTPGPSPSGARVSRACTQLTPQGWMVRPRPGAPGELLAARRADDDVTGILLAGRDAVVAGTWSEVARTVAGPTLALRVATPLIPSITRVGSVAPVRDVRVFPCGGR